MTAVSDLWLIDVDRDVATRLTSDARSILSSVWSPDGRRIAFAMPRGAPPFLHVLDVREEHIEVLLPSEGTNQWPWDWPEQASVVFGDRDPETNWDIWMLSLADGKTSVLLRTRFRERDARVSPDGQRIAYVSDESGNDEIYVRTYPGLEGKRRLSTDGGFHPEWNGDGSELFYMTSDKAIVAVTMSAGAETAVELFRDDALLDYDVTADGQRFLVNVREDESPSSAVTLLNWTALDGR